MESLPPPPTIHCTDCSNFAHFWPCLPTFPTDIWRLLAALGGVWPPLPSFGGSKPLSVAFGTLLDVPKIFQTFGTLLLVVFLGHFEMFSILFGHFLCSLPTVGHLSYGPQCGGKGELQMQKYCCIFTSLGLELLTGNTSTATLWCALTKKIGNC